MTSKAKTKKPPDQAKLERKHILEQQKRLKPVECLKYIKCFIGTNIFSEIDESGNQFLLHNKLAEAKVRYEYCDLYENLVFWERSDQQTLFNKENTLDMTEKFTKESNVILIMNALNFTSAPQFLTSQIKKLKTIWPVAPLITVGIYGMESLTSKTPPEELETRLTELQIFEKINVRLLHTFVDFADMVVNFSKAVSEIPFKKQEAAKFSTLSCGFLMNDNKDCVRVEEENNAGMSRLWQQHLTRLPLVTLDVAEAIMHEFSCPKKLLDFKENSTETEFVNFIADIRIKRSLYATFENARRVGPELAKKLLTLFGTINPNEFL
ncbi:EME1 family protein [Megaselia abdita]